MSPIDLYFLAVARIGRQIETTAKLPNGLKLVIDLSYGEYRFYNVASLHILVMMSCSQRRHIKITLILYNNSCITTHTTAVITSKLGHVLLRLLLVTCFLSLYLSIIYTFQTIIANIDYVYSFEPTPLLLSSLFYPML